MSDNDAANRFAEQALTTATGQLERGLRQDWYALHTGRTVREVELSGDGVR